MARLDHDFKEWGTGERAGSASAVQLTSTSTPCKTVLIKAAVDNAGNVYVGNSSSVTVANGSTDTTTGYELDAGHEVRLMVGNLTEIYFICNNAGDDFTYVWMG